MVDTDQRQTYESSNTLSSQQTNDNQMEFERLKKHIEYIFMNENIINNIPLRLRMQNSGGWIPFSFLNYLKGKSCTNLKIWEQAIEEMNDLFEVKDKKFRRREMFPNLEVEIYDKSVLLIPLDGNTIDTEVTQPQLKELLAKISTFKGAHYRCIQPNENVPPRDISRLLRRCGSLKQTSFVWLELKQGKSICEALIKLNDPNNPLAATFSSISLADFINQQKKENNEFECNSPRQRSATSTSANDNDTGYWNSKNKNSNSRNSSSGFWSNVSDNNHIQWGPAKNSDKLLDCSTNNEVNNKILPIFSHHQDNNDNHKQSTIRNDKLIAIKTRGASLNSATTTGAATAAGSSKQSEGETDAAAAAIILINSQPLHKHATDGERPQFITRKNVLNNVPGAGDSGVRVLLLRQPRGPTDVGFNKGISQI